MNSGTILFCATDAGGMRNILPVFDLIEKKKHLKARLIASDATVSFLQDRIDQYELLTFLDDKDAKNYLSRTSPSSIICGTTRYLSPERLLTKGARELGISAVAVLDEWFNYRRRFDDRSGDLAYLPNIVCCQDKQAKQESVNEGIPENVLHVTGSPSLSDLTTRAEGFAKTPPTIPYPLHKFPDYYSIIFISETHANDYGESPGDSGPLGNFLGYTENTVRHDLFNVLTELEVPFLVVEKAHPSAGSSPVSRPGDKNVRWICLKEVDLWSLLWHSNLVIGMRSMALLEAKVLGCSAISYQPNLIGSDLCTAARLGLIKTLSNISQLHEFIYSQVRNGWKREKRHVVRYPFADKSSVENILELALGKHRAAL